MEEVPTRIEPCLIMDDMPSAVVQAAARISELSTALGQELSPSEFDTAADAVALDEARHSLLIERIDPDIDEGKPLVAKHVSTQFRYISRPLEPASRLVAGSHIEELHASFMSGESGLRQEGQDVIVGRHFPPSGGRVKAFLDHYARRMVPSVRNVIHIPAAHHRLAFVHPFMDGNGRLCRLHSQTLFAAALGRRPLWSLSRALSSDGLYLSMMDMADMPRQGALDGRGNLSQKALIAFTKWFLERVEREMETCLT